MVSWLMSKCENGEIKGELGPSSNVKKMKHGELRVLQGINRKMPVLLQDKSKFSLLGYYAADFSSNGQSLMVRGKGNKHINSTSKRTCLCAEQHAPEGMRGRWRCGCHKFDVILEQCRAFSLKDNIWAQIVCDNSQSVSRKVELMPKVHHIHRKGEAIFQLDVHVVFYGILHLVPPLSLGFKSSSEQDAVILSNNTANAAKVFTEANNSAKRSRVPFHFFCMFSILTWQPSLLYRLHHSPLSSTSSFSPSMSA
ncbi:hypothetical protein HAX54_040542 [Datura stramonium]|uniref:Uncharacterized protein n=1 Tax=Datura stramonium TaxID=4076 RepID=A0ABS8SKF8_DATST|nr:hypothetical protein [Datura stramonium]